MSKDIRSFFTVISKKSSSNQTQKPKKTIIDSDDEVIEGTPENIKKKPLQHKRRAVVLSSDSDDEGRSKVKSPVKKTKLDNEKPKKEEKIKLKPINFDSINRPIKQNDAKPPEGKVIVREKAPEKTPRKKSKKKTKAEAEVHGDKDFVKTLEDLDDDSDDTILLENLDFLDKTLEEAMAVEVVAEDKIEITAKDKSEEKKPEHKSKDVTRKESDKKGKEKSKSEENKAAKKDKYKSKPDERKRKESPNHKDKSAEIIEDKSNSPGIKHKQSLAEFYKSSKEDKSKTPKVKDKKEKSHSSRKEEHMSTPKRAEKRPRDVSEGTPTPKKKTKLEQSDSGIDPETQELEKWEKKRQSAGLYAAYLHRGGPKNHGQKEYPKGKPNCLSGLTFLRTGVLDSLEGDEFGNLVTEHGGRVVHSVSKKVNYMVVGDDPGPAKLEKSRKYNIPEINEDELLDMILVKSEMKPKYAIKQEESEDYGIGGSEEGSPKSNKVETKIKVEEAKKEVTEPVIKREPVTPKKPKTPTKDAVEIVKEPKEEPITKSSEPENQSWTDKYKPSNIKGIIGQQDANSNMNKLKRWLENWFKNQEPDRRKKLPRPTLYNQYDGAYFKAALLSGPPGVGKTTTATLVSKELGFDIVEFNASDTRSKKLLHEEISQMMQSKTVAGFMSGKNNMNQKRVLLMDEVDGMAGNEDRGGIAELINFIKTASFPIICMCNNRDLPKMKSLVNHCYGLKFGKPNVMQVRGAMLSICFKEGLTIKPDALAQLITGTGCDIRQTLNHLSMWSAAEKNLSIDVVKKESEASQKDVVFGVWDVIKKVFNKEENKDMSFADKSRLFFYDYSFGPMFVQENYLGVEPELKSKLKPKMETLIRRSLTADSLSRSDLIESKIRSTNNWALLESQAFASTVIPSYYLSGKMGQVRFPGWFGKNSQRTKSLRMISELYSHCRTCISGDKFSIRLDYAEPLLGKMLVPLKEKQAAGIDEVLDVMRAYSLLRDDLTNLCDLMTSFFQKFKNPFDDVSAATKSALTRKYNKTMVPSVAASKKKKATPTDMEEFGEEGEDNLSEDEGNDDNVNTDDMIKVKNSKAATSKGSTKEAKSKGKSSKAGESKGSKGKAKK